MLWVSGVSWLSSFDNRYWPVRRKFLNGSPVHCACTVWVFIELSAVDRGRPAGSVALNDRPLLALVSTSDVFVEKGISGSFCRMNPNDTSALSVACIGRFLTTSVPDAS